jgi:hypothetical protein
VNFSAGSEVSIEAKLKKLDKTSRMASSGMLRRVVLVRTDV